MEELTVIVSVPVAVVVWFIVAVIVMIPFRLGGMSGRKADNFQWIIVILMTIATAAVVAIVLQQDGICYLEDGLQGLARHILTLFDEGYCL